MQLAKSQGIPDVEARLNTHEEVCAFRYESINARLKRLEQILLGVAGFVIVFLLSQSYAHAQDTTINYKGQPVPSAMAPSMSAFSQDVCGIGISGAVNGGVFSVAGGTMVTDNNCVKLKWAKFFHDSGLKVAAVSLACQATRENWMAMEMSGSPCPIGGAIGNAARRAWFELHPEWFHELYGTTFTLPLVTDRSE
jgi:hypothetical protein